MVSQPHSGNIQPQLDLEEHDHSLTAKKVSIVGGTGNDAIVSLLQSIAASLGGGGTPFNMLGQDTAVVSTTDTKIFTYTVPALTTVSIQGFSGTGTAVARFTLKVAGTEMSFLRTSAAERSQALMFSSGVIKATAGQEIAIYAYHEETANQTLQTNVFGYTT